jgi:glucose/arabinose dehydrogenase
LADADRPTQATWGPDGRLYAGGFNGLITILRFDDDYRVVERSVISTLEGLPNRGILGIATNPYDPPDPVRIYVAHSALLSAGCGDTDRPYTGQVSRLTGPDFDTVEPVVTGLPSSGGTHAVNGLAFDDAGDLLIAIGSSTNAGVPSCTLGGLPDSPFSGAIVRAETSMPGFDGNVVYLSRDDGGVRLNQTDGDDVDVAPGVDVGVLAAGFRNAFDLVVTQSGRVYATDNGPNDGEGAASVSAIEEGPDPEAPDELNLVELGAYHGHPNRNRGAYDGRQNAYRGLGEPSSPEFAQALTTFPASTDGITEFTSAVLGGGYRGALVAQQWDGATFLIRLSGDGRSVRSHAEMPFDLPALDVVVGPGGALLGIDFTGNAVWAARPVMDDGGSPAVHDVFPSRLWTGQDNPVVIAGVGFSAGLRASIGGVGVRVEEASPTRIRATLPAHLPLDDLADVVVEQDDDTLVLPDGVRLFE